MDKQLDEVQTIVSDLQQRDDNLYRAILQADPIPLSVRNPRGINPLFYEDLLNMTNSQIAVGTAKKLDELKRQVYIQSKSYDELVDLFINNEKRLDHLPAIQPVLFKDLTRMASGYGWRTDPIHNVRRFHHGMDFTAPTGTDIYATANGIVESQGWRQGFGNCVVIDHGFNYKTLYAHMHRIFVRKGQSVHRGEIIGHVGNTGKSTGPHLHYEVHHKGSPVDPRNYYFLDLSHEEYDLMVQMSNNSGQMLD